MSYILNLTGKPVNLPNVKDLTADDFLSAMKNLIEYTSKYRSEHDPVAYSFAINTLLAGILEKAEAKHGSKPDGFVMRDGYVSTYVFNASQLMKTITEMGIEVYQVIEFGDAYLAIHTRYNYQQIEEVLKGVRSLSGGHDGSKGVTIEKDRITIKTPSSVIINNYLANNSSEGYMRQVTNIVEAVRDAAKQTPFKHQIVADLDRGTVDITFSEFATVLSLGMMLGRLQSNLSRSAEITISNQNPKDRLTMTLKLGRRY